MSRLWLLLVAASSSLLVGFAVPSLERLSGAAPPDSTAVDEPSVSVIDSTTPGEPLPSIVAMDVADAQTIDAPGDADWVAVGTTAAWVANVGGGIRRYDLATGA